MVRDLSRRQLLGSTACGMVAISGCAAIEETNEIDVFSASGLTRLESPQPNADLQQYTVRERDHVFGNDSENRYINDLVYEVEFENGERTIDPGTVSKATYLLSVRRTLMQRAVNGELDEMISTMSEFLDYAELFIRVDPDDVVTHVQNRFGVPSDQSDRIQELATDIESKSSTVFGILSELATYLESFPYEEFLRDQIRSVLESVDDIVHTIRTGMWEDFAEFQTEIGKFPKGNVPQPNIDVTRPSFQESIEFLSQIRSEQSVDWRYGGTIVPTDGLSNYQDFSNSIFVMPRGQIGLNGSLHGYIWAFQHLPKPFNTLARQFEDLGDTIMEATHGVAFKLSSTLSLAASLCRQISNELVTIVTPVRNAYQDMERIHNDVRGTFEDDIERAENVELSGLDNEWNQW